MIQGQIVRLNREFRNVSLDVYQQSDFGWDRVRSTSPSDSDLDYAIDGLATGPYRVGVSWFHDGQHSIYYPDAATIEDAQDVAVVAGEVTPGINFVIGQDLNNATIGGFVSSDGARLAGIRVEISYSPITQFYDSWQHLVHVFTNEDGYYLVNGLAEGKYRLYFSDPAGRVAPIYYGQVDREQDAAIVRLGNSTQVTNVNVDMPVLGVSYIYLPSVSRE